MSKSTATYTPRPDSLPSIVIGYFTNNPGEELTLEDITAKFETPRNNIHTNLSLAVDAGLLVRARNDDGEYVYKAGKAIPRQIDIDRVHRGHATAPSTSEKKATSGYQSPRKALDLSNLIVEEGVPYLLNAAHKGASKWQPLFDKLTKPGQSIAIPGDMRGAVGAAVGKVNKLKTEGTFRVAMTGSDSARVWRIA